MLLQHFLSDDYHDVPIQAKERNIKDDANVQERRKNSGIKQSQGKVQVCFACIHLLFEC